VGYPTPPDPSRGVAFSAVGHKRSPSVEHGKVSQGDAAGYGPMIERLPALLLSFVSCRVSF
jgi:hypothetical protein